ncbi:MAG: Asp-tRNA(Asn)/Glu-tRNA(Gln) amidotransferase subunit GatB [Nanoarchaeota archaeon]
MKQEILEGMIGLEIHTYLITKEKLFCQCIASRERGLQPNINVCPICTGQPGAKPMLSNKTAVKKAIQIGLMLQCKINEHLIWQRKHYSWPDLPKGYQNTLSGKYAIPVGEKGKFQGIKISSMHLEEDPASWNPETGEIDYNRSGLPLVEIITEPEFATSEEVTSWLNKLIHNLAYLKCVDSNAGIKVDVNVNIPGKSERVEIKNVSSIENIGKAIDYELQRHMKESVKSQETRRYDEAKNKTVLMRTKEQAEDYRFISDPDLQNIILNKKLIDSERDKIPESPEIKLEKLVRKNKIDKKSAEVLIKHVDIIEFFEKVIEKVDAKFAISWTTIELLRFLNYNNTTLDKVDIKPEHFIALLKLVKEGKITELQGKQLLNKFYPKSFMPNKIEGKIADKKELKEIAEKVIKENSKAAEDYRAGEKKALDFLMGRIMSATGRRADFKIAKEILHGLLRK